MKRELPQYGHKTRQWQAYFDRTFLEVRLPLFASLPWACSYAQLPWRDAGFGSAKLEYLCWSSGFFYDAHRGGADCRALLELLSRPLPGSSRPAIAELVARRMHHWLGR